MKKMKFLLTAAVITVFLAGCGKKTETGTYSGEKYIEAMNCDISVTITLEEDGTFTYYRGPMVMEGIGEMPDLTDKGTFETEDGEITFLADELGEYTLDFIENGDGTTSMEGNVPTGGPTTEMSLTKQ